MSTPAVETEPKPLYVVGVGASAGGLEALQQLFQSIPRTGEMAFVVVQHLSPDFKSLMDELLSPHTELNVHRAEDAMRVEPDGIYLLPPRNDMIISGGKLFLTEREPGKGLSLPIDSFFRSLAEDLGARGIAIVLSGTGSDGSRGIRAVHEAGGLVISQSEDSAKFTGMPRSATDTGVVDLVLPAEGIGPMLVKFIGHDGRLADLATPATAGDCMTRIFDLLQRESGIDFAEYKPSTVSRRIERRLLLSDTRDLDQYVERIANDGAELRALYKDLLIGVTRFFRDAEAFDRLRLDVIPQILERVPPGEEVRIWTPGCATGEEAYSLTIVLLDTFRAKGRTPLFRIFATDVHRHSLETAGAGVYPTEALANVPLEVRQRYFQHHQDGMQVTTDLRSHIVFAHHNVVRDAPFTRLDLLVCRNLLIYFKPPAQRRVLALFHFALEVGGTLMLGPSETPGPLGEEFATVDARWKVFRKTRDVRIAPELRLSAGGGMTPESGLVRAISPRQPAEDPRVTRARELLLERYAPPTLIVDSSGRLLHNFNGGGELLTQRDGKPSLNVLELLEGEVRFVVAGALKRAQKENRAVSYGAVTVSNGHAPKRVRVSVQPMGAEESDSAFAIVFEPDHGEPHLVSVPRSSDVDSLMQERLVSVESELRITKENLQTTIEEMETSNEELQATNEELIASNEELQSTNEELHSVNEELYTVNAEYQTKISELTELTADMNHLLEATEVHTIFLDRELRLRKFTPKIAETFNLLPQDLGRRLDGFAHNLNDNNLLPDLERVARDGGTVAREVSDRAGHPYLLRVLPYRTIHAVEGVVLTLVDLSALKKAKDDLAVSEERYRTLVRSITAILWTADKTGRFTVPQPEWESYTGHGWDKHQGFGWLEAIHPEDRERVRHAWSGAVAERKVFEAQGRLLSRASGLHRHFFVRAAPLLNDDGEVREWVGHIIDVHDSKTAELELHRKETQIRAILDHSPAFIWVKDPGGRYVVAGRQCETLLGVPCNDVIGKTDYDFWPVAVSDSLRTSERRCLESGSTEEVEEIVPIDGQAHTFLTVKFPLRDEQNQIYALAGISTDITERKRDAEEIRQAVERRDQFLAMLSHELRTPLGAILNAAELLDRAGQHGPTRAGDVIRRLTRHMAKLIEDLLDVGRVTRDQLNLETRFLNFSTIVQDVGEMVRSEAERKELKLTLRLPPVPLAVRGDAARLRQIVTNLLNNAITYTTKGGIEVSLRAEGRRVLLDVCDTGMGLTGEEMSRVFDLFYQSPQALDRKRGGLGVGLTLALKLARLHGGGISAESNGHGTGSRFTLSLPQAEGSLEESQPMDVIRPNSRLRIVLVEDNEDIRDTLQDLLRLEGHDVHAEADGIRGAESIVEKTPDVAIVDLGLPGMDGYEVAKAVRSARGSTVRLIALTGYGRREDRMETAGAGFDRHLVKPVDHEVLMRVLAEIAADRRPDA